MGGIPQGTILDAMLFIIYINDLPDIFKQFANVYLFADDAKLYRHILSDEDHYTLQSGLCALQEWSDKWRRKLNASRCKAVYYSRDINHNYAYNYVLRRIVYTILTCRY